MQSPKIWAVYMLKNLSGLISENAIENMEGKISRKRRGFVYKMSRSIGHNDPEQFRDNRPKEQLNAEILR